MIIIVIIISIVFLTSLGPRIRGHKIGRLGSAKPRSIYIYIYIYIYMPIMIISRLL